METNNETLKKLIKEKIQDGKTIKEITEMYNIVLIFDNPDAVLLEEIVAGNFEVKQKLFG